MIVSEDFRFYIMYYIYVLQSNYLLLGLCVIRILHATPPTGAFLSHKNKLLLSPQNISTKNTIR